MNSDNDEIFVSKKDGSVDITGEEEGGGLGAIIGGVVVLICVCLIGFFLCKSRSSFRKGEDAGT